MSVYFQLLEVRWVEPGSQLKPRLHLSVLSMVVKQNKFRVSVHVGTGFKDTILKVEAQLLLRCKMFEWEMCRGGRRD